MAYVNIISATNNNYMGYISSMTETGTRYGATVFGYVSELRYLHIYSIEFSLNVIPIFSEFSEKTVIEQKWPEATISCFRDHGATTVPA